MGIHVLEANSESVPTMADLWAAHAGPAMGMDGDWQRSGGSSDHLLRVEALNVYPELRPGRLGDT